VNEVHDKARDAVRYMTQSKVSMWTGDCHQKFAYVHIHDLRRPPAAYIGFGSAWDRFQTASAGFQAPYETEPEKRDGYWAHKMKEGKDLPASQARDLFVDIWREEAEAVEEWEDANAEDLEQTGLKGVDAFLKTEVETIEPVRLQTSLQIAVEDKGELWSVSGTLDLGAVDSRSGDRPIIIDAKTAKAKWPAGKAQSSLQAVHYSLLADNNRENYIRDLNPDLFAFSVLIKRKRDVAIQNEVAVIDDTMRQSHLRAIADVRREIILSGENEYWRPNRQSWLCSKRLCPFHKECVAQHGGYVKE